MSCEVVEVVQRRVSTADITLKLQITNAKGELQYIPFPICNETGRPLELVFGSEKGIVPLGNRSLTFACNSVVVADSSLQTSIAQSQRFLTAFSTSSSSISTTMLLFHAASHHDLPLLLSMLPITHISSSP